MRNFMYVIVVLVIFLLQLTLQATIEISGNACVGVEDGTSINTGDPCVTCTCFEQRLQCLNQFCPEIMCHPKLIQKKDDQCCPTCLDGCVDDNFGFIEAGSEASDDRGCTTCMCSLDSDLQCISLSCLPCEGNSVDDGTCCGKCEVHHCRVGDKVFKNGEVIPVNNPCDTCHCVVSGDHVDMLCSSMACEECPGIWTKDETCCGKCEVNNTTCFHDGIEYRPGQDILTENPCEMCSCVHVNGFAETQCAEMMCPMCIGRSAPDGSCCGTCEPMCFHEGQEYPVGIDIPSENHCEFCSCQLNNDGIANAVCAVMDCARCPEGFMREPDTSCCGKCVPYKLNCDLVRCMTPSCPLRMQYKDPEKCCAECKCQYKRKTYNPGPVGPKCSGCVCSNGKVTCTPPVCPKKNLQCVDAKLGEDCCYHCPNGKTCSYGVRKNQVIIKYGEYRFINGRIVACSGDPWFPLAFQVSDTVGPFLRRKTKKFTRQIADYMEKSSLAP